MQAAAQKRIEVPKNPVPLSDFSQEGTSTLEQKILGNRGSAARMRQKIKDNHSKVADLDGLLITLTKQLQCVRNAHDEAEIHSLVKEGISLVQTLGLAPMENARFDWNKDRTDFYTFIISSVVYMYDCCCSGLNSTMKTTGIK